MKSLRTSICAGLRTRQEAKGNRSLTDTTTKSSTFVNTWKVQVHFSDELEAYILQWTFFKEENSKPQDSTIESLTFTNTSIERTVPQVTNKIVNVNAKKRAKWKLKEEGQDVAYYFYENFYI